MKERYVVEALQKAVIAAVAASSVPSLKVKMLGRTIKPQADEQWLEVIHIPNNINDNWGASKTYRGMLRLVLHSPNEDKGVYAPMTLIMSISGYFTKGRKLQDVTPDPNVVLTVTEEADFMGVAEEAHDLLYPVSIQYLYYSS